MKSFIKSTAIFLLLTFAVSQLTSCSKQPAANAPDANAAAAEANTNSGSGKSSEYPPLNSNLAASELELLDGSKFTLGDKKGKVVLANIWGTWCGPCRAEMPLFIALQDQYRDKGFEVIGLNIGDGRGNPESVDDIKRFALAMKLNYTIAIMPNDATALFQGISKQSVVPQTLLIDRDGHLRGVFVGGGQRIGDLITTNVEKVVNEGS